MNDGGRNNSRNVYTVSRLQKLLNCLFAMQTLKDGATVTF